MSVLRVKRASPGRSTRRPGRVLAAMILFGTCVLLTPLPHAVAQDGGATAGVGDRVAPGGTAPGGTVPGGTAHSGVAGAERFLALEARAQLLVSDQEAAAEALITWTEEQGGYFVERSLERVVLRLPADAFDELRAVAGSTAEDVITYNPSAQDLRQELSFVEAAIAGREENLERVLAFLDESDDIEGTLALEREISSLMQELEALRGRGRAIRTRIAYARAEIALSARAADIPDRVPSSFDWLNSLDLYDFIEEVAR